MSAEILVYVVSPVRQVTVEQTAEIATHVENLNRSGARVFNPVKDAPQEDKTGINIVMAELNFMHRISKNEGRVDILWNAGGIPSEGSRVDLGMAIALGIKFNLITVFNQEQPTGPQLGLQVIREAASESQNDSSLFRKIGEMLDEIRGSSEVTIDWSVEMSTEKDEWQRIYLGLALGCMAQNPALKIKMGNLVGVDPVGKKSYPKVIKEVEGLQSIPKNP